MKKLSSLENRLDKGPIVPTADAGRVLLVPACDILYFRKDGQDCVLALKDGGFVKAAIPFEEVKALISGLPGFLQIQKSAWANFQSAGTITRINKNEYELRFNPGSVITINQAYKIPVQEFYGLRSLDHIDPFDRPSYWLLKEDIHHYEKPIWFMGLDELRANFSDQAGNPVFSLLIANYLYQFAWKIRNREAEPLEGGNVRSLWYMIKPAIARLGGLETYDHYKTLSEVLARLVTRKIVTYREYGLTEDENWQIGKTNPHVILLAEKRAHLKFIKTLGEQYGVTILSSGGVPAMITMEYFSEALKKAVPHINDKEIPVITLTDYDPAGDLIVETFLDDLKTYNIDKTKFIRMVHPTSFTPEEIEAYKYNLVKDEEMNQTMIKKWVRKTGGINGEPYGLETDALMITPSKVRQMFYDKAKQYLSRNTNKYV